MIRHAPDIPRRPAAPRRRRRRRRGTVFVTAVWVTLILGAAVLVFARSMRVELLAAANQQSADEAAAIERGAEQYVLAQVERGAGDARTITAAPAEAVPVGSGYFWLLRPDPADARRYDYGIADEAAKLNLNTAAPAELAQLPGLSDLVSGAIADWRDPDDEITPQGAEKEYYLSLPEPYAAKNAPLETVEELRLVRGVTEAMLRGYDRNLDGVIDPAERATRDPIGAVNNSAPRGVYPYATVSTLEPNADADGKARVNVNLLRPAPPPPGAPGGPVFSPDGNVLVPPTQARAMAAPPGVPSPPQPQPGQPGQPGQPEGDPAAPLREVLQKGLPGNRADEVMNRARAAAPFGSVLDFAVKGGLSSAELRDVIDRLTWQDGPGVPGLVNVNTAPREVLRCVAGLDSSDVEALLGRRVGNDRPDAAWVLDALPPEKIAAAGGRLTGRSLQYSADIVAVSADGRAFRRVRIVVDGRASPPVIVRRKDLTDLGWPLPEDIRESLRSGRGISTRVHAARAQGLSR